MARFVHLDAHWVGVMDLTVLAEHDKPDPAWHSRLSAWRVRGAGQRTGVSFAEVKHDAVR
jgi:hypothetical protein